MSPNPTTDPWLALDLPETPLLAELAPDDVDRRGVAPRSSFTLRSLTEARAVDLAVGLRSDPEIQMSVEPGPSPDVAVIRPSEALVDGRRYRFQLDAPDGSLAGSWAFVVRAPLKIVGTLPGDRAVGVPGNTGIEITFDTDATIGFAERFSIAPVVPGRTEQHGRTWTFLPDKPLAPATIYTVTIRHGVMVDGSDATLESDLIFRFETGSPSQQGSRVLLARAIQETRPGQPTEVGLVVIDDEESAPARPTSLPITIHRLPTPDAALNAARALTGVDSWAVASAGRIAVDGLQKVAELDAPVVGSDYGDVLRIPTGLDRGHYVVTLGGPSGGAQLLLQVTNVAGYAMTAGTSTLVWVNDLASGDAIGGATVALATTGEARSLGVTADDGTVTFPTPTAPVVPTAVREDEEVVSATLLVVSVTGRTPVILALGMPMEWPYGERNAWINGAGLADWWLLFETDRYAYRPSDTIHTYGVLRRRSDRSVPTTLELRLRTWDGDPDAWITRVTSTPTARGTFGADIPLADLPTGDYVVDLVADGQRVWEVWVAVSTIRKPAYELEVTTDRRAYLLGDAVRVSIEARFFDGTPVPGIDLRVEGFGRDASATTDAVGHAETTLEASDPDLDAGLWFSYISVAPTHAEEGDVSGDTRVMLLPGRDWITAEGVVSGSRIRVDGSLTLVDMVRLEADLDDGGEIEAPAGTPIASGSVRASVVHLVPISRQIGTTYDFIEKRVVPLYEYDVKRVSLPNTSLTSRSDGTFSLDYAVPIATDDYEVTLSATDAAGRVTTWRTVVGARELYENPSAVGPYLEGRSVCGVAPTITSRLGVPATLTMRSGDGDPIDNGRFLFVVSSNGVPSTIVQASPAFTTTLADAQLPGITVRAVWLGPSGYFVADAAALVAREDKTLDVQLEADRPRYAPGDPVAITITTRNAAGAPVQADVVVTGVDQKLIPIGAAGDVDPLDQLLAPVPAGFGAAYRSHAAPIFNGEGCGDTGGGRDDFRDAVTFQRVKTNDAGRATVRFDLPDDLTSWHISALGVSGALDAGSGSILVPVSLPFFVDAVLAPEYLVGDRPVLRVRSYGDGLRPGDVVRFTVASPSLGFGPVAVEGQAFEAVRVELPALAFGSHAITVEAEAGDGATVQRDAIVRTIRVIDSRLTVLRSAYELLGPGFAPHGGTGFTTYVISDAGRGRYVEPLRELASMQSARFDRLAAAELARRTLIREFDVAEASLPETGFAWQRYQVNGIALLPYASGDLELTARAALVAAPVLFADDLRWQLREFLDSASGNRERQLMALAGLAALDENVLAELRAVAAAGLSIRESLWLALGLVAAGDEASARSIERELLQAHGQRLGPWARLVAGAELATFEATSLALLLAGRLGDPIGDDLARYLKDNPSTERVADLELVGYITGRLERLPRVAGAVAWTLDGERHEVSLAPGQAVSLTLTPAQRAGLTLEGIEGALSVVTTWTERPATLPSDSRVTVSRSVTPAGSAPDDRLVRVTLTVQFRGAIRGCYRLTDLLPSGLAPVASTAGWSDDSGGSADNWPWLVEGQRIAWCASVDDASHAYSYSARVVTPGTYRWEPAVIQSEIAPSIGSATAEATYTIR